ncbi:MAG: hypothetical protein ACR2LH_02615 [Thermoleophilaceae bacterium]
MTLLRDLIDIPEKVTPGDLVMELASGIDHPDQTVGDYVVTPQLVSAFDDALGIVAASARDGQSRATYLHGSFGSGKSHFMAVLHLLLRGEPAARRIPALQQTIAKHDPSLGGSNWLLVSYHMLGKQGLEQAILGGYAAHVAALHPEAPEAPVFVDREVLENAAQLRAQMGDETFFGALSQGDTGAAGFGKYSAAWTAATYDAAAAAGPTDLNRERLVGALLRNILPSYRSHHAGDTQAFLDLDGGLAAITRHAKALGYTGIVLFLDELILWLASKLQAEGGWAQTEASKVAKLRESGDAHRELPIVSFVARQRDLRDFIGKGGSGAEQAAVADTLGHGDGRFSVVPLEDQNLPEIARQRVLAPRDDAAAAAIDRAFEEVAADTLSDRGVLLTSTGTLTQFRDTYPFTPALMSVLVALSSALQRNRTALRVLKELLSGRRDELALGDIVGVGEVWDVVMESPEPFGDGMRANAEQAQRLYREKLRPLLLAEAGISEDEARAAAWASPFRANDRLVKTLLIAALVPEVEPLRGLTASWLAALNHGSIRTRIAGKETAALVRRLNDWARTVGELKLGEDPNDPTVSIALSGVEVETVLELAKTADKPGARRLKIRELIFADIGIDAAQLSGLEREHTWRGTRRRVEVRFGNVRDPTDITDGALRPTGEGWCVVLDFPFDDPSYSPADDRARIDDWTLKHPEGAKTICWVPSFFSDALKDDLGRLVMHEQVLAGDGFRRYAQDLSETDRHSARQIIANQRDALLQRVRGGLRQAYGLERPQPGLIDTAVLGDGEAGDILALMPGFSVQRPVGATLREGFEHLVSQGLAHEFPRHPELRRDPVPRALTNIYEELRAAVAEPGGRRVINDAPTRALLNDLAQPLGLGRQSEVAFVLGDRWPTFLTKAIQQEGGTLSVGRARELLGETELAGTPTPVQNLVLLVAVEQLGRRFSEHGGVAHPTVAKLDDHLTIVEQPLPSVSTWDVAVARAQAVLGLTPNPQRTASAVGSLAEELERTLEAFANAVRALPDRLVQRAGTLGLADAGPRTATADAALELLNGVRRAADSVTRITAFASFALPAGVTEQILGASLTGAESVGEVLTREGWTTIEQLAVLSDGGDADAESTLASLRSALTEDEFVVPLEPRFNAALRQGAALVKRRLSGGGGERDGRTTGEARGTGGRQLVYGVAAAQEVLERLTADPAATDLAITISWEPRST